MMVMKVTGRSVLALVLAGAGHLLIWVAVYFGWIFTAGASFRIGPAGTGTPVVLFWMVVNGSAAAVAALIAGRIITGRLPAKKRVLFITVGLTSVVTVMFVTIGWHPDATPFFLAFAPVVATVAGTAHSPSGGETSVGSSAGKQNGRRRPKPLLRWVGIPLLGMSLYTTVVTARAVDLFAGAPSEDKDCDPTEDRWVDLAPSSLLAPSPVPLLQEGGAINDASCLNRTPIYGVAQPTSEEEVRVLLSFAADQNLSVSPAGARHSMGGQALAPGGLVLDMTELNRMSVDAEDGTLTVGAGATWREVLQYLHPRGLSVASMQGVDILTVGGSISVNAHGTDHRTGSVVGTVRSLRVMLADGTVVTADREHNTDLFRAVVGGYGLFGVILEATLELVPNQMYDFDQRLITSSDFPRIYRDEIASDFSVHLAYAHMSTDPGTLMEEAILYTYRYEAFNGQIPELGEIGFVRETRFVLNLAKTGRLGQWIKWAGQKHILPHFRPCAETRNQALGESEACWISRNQALYTSLDSLKNKIPADTDILQEYFLPHEELAPFLAEAKRTLLDHHLALLNASIRVIHPDDLLLSYAPTERFAVVLYVNQAATPDGEQRMASATRQLVELVLDRGGSFYLPYRLHYTPEQLRQAYPHVDEFFALKRSYDPDRRFTNHFYEQYGP